MKRNIKPLLKKHISELNQILNQYQVTNRKSLVAKCETDIVFQKAVLMNVGYIGELSKKLEDSFKESNPEINWRRLSKSRNIIFHEYDIVDIDIISTVIYKDINQLEAVLCND